MLTARPPLASSPPGAKAAAQARAWPEGWERIVYAVALAAVGIFYYASFVQRCVDFNWSDDDFTGWDYSIANRMSFAHRLYDPGNHTPIPPLSYVIVKLAGLGHPTWTNEMAVIVICQVAIAFMFAFGAAKAFGRWSAFVGALAGLGFFAGFTKTIAYDAVTQFFAMLAALAVAAHVEAQRENDGRRIWLTAAVAGLGCAGAVLSKQSLGVFMLPGVALALALLGRGPIFKRLLPVGLTSAAWLALISAAMIPWVNISGMVAVGILGGAETKGGSGHLVQVLDVFVKFGLTTVLVFGGVVSFVVFAIGTAMRQWRGEAETGDAADDAPRTYGLAFLALACGCLTALGFAMGMSWTAGGIPGVGPLLAVFGALGDHVGPLLMWGALYLSFTTAFLPRRRQIEAETQARAISIILIFAAVGMTLSVLEFRWTFDNNPLIMSSVALGQGFAGYLAQRVRLRILITAGAAALFVMAGWSAARTHLTWTYAATDPSPQFPELNGAKIRPDDDPWGKAVQDVKAWTLPTETALVLPEDPHTEALFERPRPPLRSGVMFVDTLQAADQIADQQTLAQNPPAVIIIAPVYAWRPWSAYLRRHSPLEQTIDWVTKTLVPARYYLAARYILPKAQWLPDGDTMLLYRLRAPAPPPAAVPGPSAKLPAWLAPGPGAQAYLEDDGRGTVDATLCDSPQSYAAFAGGGSREHCSPYPRGTPVRIAAAAGSLDLDGSRTPLYDVASPAGQRLGVIGVERLRPLVPPHTILMARASGGTPPSFWLNREISGDAPLRPPDAPSGAATLQANTLVEVLYQGAYDGDADLFVRVLTGPRRGDMGWMTGLSLPYAGVSAGQFALAASAAPH